MTSYNVKQSRELIMSNDCVMMDNPHNLRRLEYITTPKSSSYCCVKRRDDMTVRAPIFVQSPHVNVEYESGSIERLSDHFHY